MQSSKHAVWLIPAAIIFAGIILGIAVFVFRVSTASIPGGGNPDKVAPITPTDHLIGNPEAPVIIVEYSDIDSEHGKDFHAVLQQVMVDYGPGGKVAWVFRHFPLTMEHPNAFSHAVASECVAEAAGPEGFWRFLDLMNTAAPGTIQFDPDDYPALISQLGVNQASFDACLTRGGYTERIRAQVHNAYEAGADAAPYTIVLIKDQDPITVSGRLSYDQMKEVVNTALSKVP